jgi:hypothetical protein
VLLLTPCLLPPSCISIDSTVTLLRLQLRLRPVREPRGLAPLRLPVMEPLMLPAAGRLSEPPPAPPPLLLLRLSAPPPLALPNAGCCCCCFLGMLGVPNVPGTAPPLLLARLPVRELPATADVVRGLLPALPGGLATGGRLALLSTTLWPPDSPPAAAAAAPSCPEFSLFLEREARTLRPKATLGAMLEVEHSARRPARWPPAQLWAIALGGLRNDTLPMDCRVAGWR